MRRIFALTSIAMLLLSAARCGSVFIGGALEPATTVRGSIISVQLGGVTNEVGGTVQVTFVTLLQNNAFSAFTFCNNQISQFPLNQLVTVNFNPGQPCATIIAVVFIV
jgi:hypothetical protein